MPATGMKATKAPWRTAARISRIAVPAGLVRSHGNRCVWLLEKAARSAVLSGFPLGASRPAVGSIMWDEPALSGATGLSGMA